MPDKAMAVIYRRLFIQRCVHAVLTWVMLWFSYSFGGTYARYGETTLRYFAQMAPEHTWQVITGGVGMLGLMSMFITGKGSTKVRIAAAALLSATYSIVALLFFLGNQHVIATGPFIGYAFLGAALAYNTAHLDQRFKSDLARLDAQR